jgi:hypothetical protein
VAPFGIAVAALSGIIDRLAFGFFGLLGRFPTAPTDARELEALIRRLHPRACRVGLRRLGPATDGGYLVPDDLDGIEACFSPGVSDVSGFEKDCADLGMRVFMADRSVAGPAEAHPRFHFDRQYVGALNNEEFVTLDNWVARSLPDSSTDLLLQMDIEGAEYETILATSDTLMRRFRIVVAEFHQLQFLFSSPFFTIASRAFEKLLQTHTCVHIHPNTSRGSVSRRGIEIPRVMEFTFLRSDRVGDAGFASSFPHALDARNVADRDLVLPQCWYRQ